MLTGELLRAPGEQEVAQVADHVLARAADLDEFRTGADGVDQAGVGFSCSRNWSK
jgi:hypothetical protein